MIYDIVFYTMEVFDDRPKLSNGYSLNGPGAARLDSYLVDAGAVSPYYYGGLGASLLQGSRLTEPMAVTLQEVVGSDPTKLRDYSGILAVALQKGGVFTARDMFAAGRVATHRISRVGSLAKSHLALVAASFEGEPEWYDEPTPEDIARICPTLGDVPSLTLGKVAVIPNYYSEIRRVSVAEVLALGNPEGMLEMTGVWPSDSNLSAAGTALERALDIARLYGR